MSPLFSISYHSTACLSLSTFTNSPCPRFFCIYFSRWAFMRLSFPLRIEVTETIHVLPQCCFAILFPSVTLGSPVFLWAVASDSNRPVLSAHQIGSTIPQCCNKCFTKRAVPSCIVSICGAQHSLLWCVFFITLAGDHLPGKQFSTVKSGNLNFKSGWSQKLCKLHYFLSFSYSYLDVWN